MSHGTKNMGGLADRGFYRVRALHLELMYSQGATPRECGERYGIGPERVKQILRARGVCIYQPVRRPRVGYKFSSNL